MLDNSNKVVCIVGPTASGKTDISQIVANELEGEIVSADSMQIYKGMDIGTGKIPKNERIVKHWGLDIVDPGTPYSAALFQKYAREKFLEIIDCCKQPFLVGGTGFYVRAAIDNYEFPEGEQEGNPVREKYEAYLKEKGSESLWKLLDSKDAESANVIHPNNSKRVIRALELHENGESYARLSNALKDIEQVVPAIFIGLEVKPEILYKRIDDRVDKMRELGLIREVEDLLDKGFREGLTASQAIGYKEIVQALDGQISMDEAFDQIKQSTRRYSKRQRTWFRKDKRINWIDANDANVQKLAELAMLHL